MVNIKRNITSSKILLIVVILIFNNFSVQAEEIKFNAEKCNLLWFDISNKHGKEVNKVLLKKWLAVSPKCNGTGIYEFRLGVIYERLGMSDKFKNIVEKGLALKSPYNHYLKVSQLTILLSEAAKENRIDSDLERKLVAGYEGLIKSHKDWIVPYESLTNIYTLFKNPDKIIFYARKSLELNNNSYMGHLGLVIGYTYKKKYKDARPHIMLAAGNNEKLFSNVEFMCAAAWIYASLNEHELASSVLNRLLTENPRAKKTDRMKKTYFYAKKRYENSLGVK